MRMKNGAPSNVGRTLVCRGASATHFRQSFAGSSTERLPVTFFQRFMRCRGSFILIAVLAVIGTACKSHHDRVTVQNEEQTTTPGIKSLVWMNDAAASTQLNSGFYGLENNSWRWTAGKFSVTLRTPPGAAASGGVVALSYSVPEVAIKTAKNIAITASVNGTKLNSATLDTTGPGVFAAEVPATLLTADSIKVDYELDKTFQPEADKRQLGIIAMSVGLTSK
jgi:hypothetical protein